LVGCEAEAARDAAIDRGVTSAHEAWKNRFKFIVNMHLARSPKPFTSGDVIDLVKHYFPQLKTHDQRAAGGLMVALQKEGVIRPTGRYVRSRRKRSHCRPMREWIGVR
jgi:hypothetical protein